MSRSFPLHARVPASCSVAVARTGKNVATQTTVPHAIHPSCADWARVAVDIETAPPSIRASWTRSRLHVSPRSLCRGGHPPSATSCVDLVSPQEVAAWLSRTTRKSRRH